MEQLRTTMQFFEESIFKEGMISTKYFNVFSTKFPATHNYGDS